MNEMENFDNLENNSPFFFFTSDKSEHQDYCLLNNLKQSGFDSKLSYNPFVIGSISP